VPETVTINVNGKEIEVPKGELVIDAAERHGVYIPRFCYHPRMTPVGMCRMCVVEVDTGRGPALQPACMLNVADGMKVDTRSAVTKKAQDAVLEFLLINHPLDCPVCDKGGECPLQDQTMAYGPGESRFVEEKRHFEKPIPISNLVYLDRERCILCDRCTRFAGEVAGDAFISFLERGGQTEVNTFPDHPFASYFSGNTVQICPVGALTAAPFRFRARPWDMEAAESTCTVCAVGCRITIESSRDQVLRYQGVDVDPVNWGWLCDKGRFSFQSIQSPDRLAAPLVADGDGQRPAGWGEALSRAAEGLRGALDRAGAAGVGVLGGARLANEGAYAWSKLARTALGTDNVDAQLGDGLPADLVLGLPRATIDEACAARTVVLLAPDVKEELPVLYLRLRHAVKESRTRVVELAPARTGLTGLAAVSLPYRPGEVGAVARALAGGTVRGDAGGVAAEDLRRAAELVADAGEGGVVVILGRPSLAESAASVADAAAVLAGLPGARFLPALRRGNVHGALDMGLSPGLLPGRTRLEDGRAWFEEAWGTVAAEPGLDATGILTAAAEGRLGALVLLGADPLTDFPDRDLARRALAGAGFVLAVDTFPNASNRLADVVLAASGLAETEGTTTNIEGRVSRLHQRVNPPGTARPDWVIASELAFRLGADLGFESVQGVWEEIERLSPVHTGMTWEMLSSPSATDGVVAPLEPGTIVADALTLRDHEGAVVTGGPTELVENAPDEAAAGKEGEAASAALAGEGSQDIGERQAGHAESAVRSAEATQADEAREPGGVPGSEAPEGDASGRRPSPLSVDPTPADRPAELPARDAYSLRLVVHRRLYDQGTMLEHAESLAPLAPGAVLRLHPADHARLGVEPGAGVRVSSSRGTLTVPALPDVGVPKGTAVLPFNQPGASAADLIDATAPVTDVRVEAQAPAKVAP
jgi:NADH-quinone oxidoreductase subunit G